LGHDPFGGETNGIPNGLGIPGLGSPGLSGCTYGTGACGGGVIFGLQGPAIPWEVDGAAEALQWLVRLLWPVALAKGGASQNPVPSWVTARPKPGETADQFADRVCKDQYPQNNGAGCGRGPGSEYNRIRKWAQEWINKHK